MTAVEWFFSFATDAQWVVIIIVGCILTGVLLFSYWWGSNNDPHPSAFVVGPAIFLTVFVAWVLLLIFISLLELLWTL